MTNYFIFIAIFIQIVGNAVGDTSCNVIPIFKWSGETSRRTAPMKAPIKLVVIQHTVSATCHADDVCESILNNIRDYQMDKLHFDDIGPSFLIGGNGKVYEGAGWDRLGAHTRGYNDKAIAISFIGDFSYELPTSKALQAAQHLIACGVKHNFLDGNYILVGHRQLSATSSPGDRLQNHITTLPHWTSGHSRTHRKSA